MSLPDVFPVDRNAQAGSAAAQLRVTNEPDREAWDAYVGTRPEASGYHLWAWRRVFERAFGHRTVYLAALRGDAITGILPLVLFRSALFGKFAISLPFVNYGGIVADDEEAARALLTSASEAARTAGCTHLELRHTTRRFEDLPCKTHKVGMFLPIEGDEAALWAGLDRKVRNQVRKAEKSGLTAVVGGAELLDGFYTVFAENMRDLGTPVYSPRFFREVFAAVPDACRVFAVRNVGTTVAAGIGYRHGTSIEVPWASSLRAFRALSPNNLMYWSVLKWAAAEGLRVLDFARSTPEEGTFHYKRQWGAEPAPLHWEYALFAGHRLPDQSPKNPKFRYAIEIWKRLPLALTTRLGPHIVRGIP
jgi:FemAB-related protein (PEP-CTERM system-associated)